jgi:hypothetical protein
MTTMTVPNRVQPPTADECVPMLSPRAMTVPGVGGHWVIAKVRPRAEKDFAADLLAAGFDYFLPLLRKKTADRHVRYLPLSHLIRTVFCSAQDEPVPGYHVPTGLFYFIIEHPAYQGMVRVPPGKQQQLVRELSEIHYGVMLNPEHADETPAKPGKKIRIKSGAFMGREAEVDAVNKKCQVTVPITLLGQTVSLTVPSSEIESA